MVEQISYQEGKEKRKQEKRLSLETITLWNTKQKLEKFLSAQWNAITKSSHLCLEALCTILFI